MNKLKHAATNRLQIDVDAKSGCWKCLEYERSHSSKTMVYFLDPHVLVVELMIYIRLVIQV